MAGRKHTAKVLADPAYKSLAEVMPVTVPAPAASQPATGPAAPRPAAWRVEPTGPGLAHPVLRFGPTPEATGQIFARLPGPYWCQPVLAVKPGATVLARVRAASSGAADNPATPMLAAHEVGRGRVVYVGTSEIWRWRYTDAGAWHERFWRNVLHYLAGREPKAAP